MLGRPSSSLHREGPNNPQIWQIEYDEKNADLNQQRKYKNDTKELTKYFPNHTQNAGKNKRKKDWNCSSNAEMDHLKEITFNKIHLVHIMLYLNSMRTS
jgi:hypothetical protein